MPLVGADLRVRREASGLSAAAFAERLGVSRALVKGWEAGRKRIPRGRLSDIQAVLAAQAPARVERMPGGELRAIRAERGLSQGELAKMLGVKQPTVAEWEARSVPEDRCDLLRQAAGSRSFPGGLLRAERERAGLKQAELGKALGVTQARVSFWEGGREPIAIEEWPRVRVVLASTAPAKPQRPVAAEELRSGRGALGWSQRQFAEAVGVKTSAVGAWEAAIKPVPARHWQRIREVLRLSAPAPERDRVAEALALVRVELGEASGGLGRLELAERVPAPEPNVRAAVLRGLQHDLIHERPVKRERGDGIVRYLPGLFAGPAPEEPPPVDRLTAVVEELVAVVAAKPGRSRRATAEDANVRHDRQKAEQAIERACQEGRLVKREVANRTGRGPLTITGLFVPAAAPAPVRPVPGAVVRKLREQLLIGQHELAVRLGVSPRALSSWERSEVPGSWWDAVAALLVPLTDSRESDKQAHIAHMRAAQSALDRRIVDHVRAHPGAARWDVARVLRPVELPLLAGRLEELLLAGKLHERPCENGHGGGLFDGPSPRELLAAQFAAGELRARRERAGLSQQGLAELVGVSVARINAWDQGTEPVPVYRLAQLRNAIAGAPPVPAAVRGAELRAERERLGLLQAELAELLGLTQTTISAWEREQPPAPAQQRVRLRELFATEQAPIAA
jgi:DNA-binding transcriptional regulator YiaG